MTKRLDPEIKALRAMERAIRPLDLAAKDRVSIWLRGTVEDELRRDLKATKGQEGRDGNR